MTEELLGVAEDVVRKARALGADACEAYVCTIDGAVVENIGPLVGARDIQDSGIAVRLVSGGKAGGANVYGTSSRSVERVVEDALAYARSLPEEGRLPTFPAPASLPAPSAVDPRLASPDPDALAAEAAVLAGALRRGEGVTYYSASLKTRAYAFAVANTQGVGAWDRDAAQSLALEVRVTEGGVHRTATDQTSGRAPASDVRDLTELAGEAVARARSALVSKPLPASTDEAVLDPVAFAQLLKVWVPSLNGSLARAGRTRLAGRLGECVASERLTIVDAPQGPGGARNQRMDDTGVATRALTVLRRGVLEAFVYGNAGAAAAGTTSTGHDYRPSDQRWGGGLAVRATNLQVAPGTATMDDLVKGVERGVVVRDGLMGAFAANDASGDFSLVCPLAFYVEKGAVQHALPPTTLAGNVHDLLAGIEDVGRDLRPLMRGGIPAVRARGIRAA